MRISDWSSDVCSSDCCASDLLSRLAEQTQSSAQDAQVNALGLRVADLERQVDADKRRPAPISQAEFANARQALDERMTRLEEADEARALAIDLQTLQARVNGIETRLEKTRQVASASRPRAPVDRKSTRLNSSH